MKASLLNSVALLFMGLMALHLCQAGTIDYVYRSMGPYTGGNTIYITGSSLFGSNPATPVVKVNGIDCTLIQATSTHATAVTPANSPAQAMNVDVECFDGSTLVSSAPNSFDYIDDEGQILTLDSSNSGGLRVDLGLYYAQPGTDHFVIVDIRSSSATLPVLKQADSQAAKTSTVINIGDSVSNSAGTFYVEPIGSEDQFTIVWEARSAANALLHTSAMAVFEYTNCPTIPDLDGSWGNAGDEVPVPSGVTFTYLPLSNKFRVDISVSYLRNNAAWMFDLTDFLSTDNIRNFRDTTLCASRSTLPTTVDFADYWESAPNAQYGGVTPLEGPFNAYPLLGNNVNQATQGAVWSVTANDCATLTYTAIFTLEQLTNCLERDGATKSVTVSKINDAGTSLITYASVLKAHAIRPVDLHDNSAGLEVASYEFPFTYRFTEAVTAISSGSSRSSFDLQVLRGYIDNSQGLQTLTLEVRTVYNPVSGDPNLLANPVVSPSQPSTGDFIVGVETNGPASCTTGSACTQTWKFTVNHWVETDNGAYKFNYDVATTSDEVFAFVTISLHPEFSDVDVSGSLKSELKLYKDESAMKNRDAAFAGSFQPTNIIYGREDVIVAPGDEDQWNLSVQDVYICYSDNPLYVIEWNPTQNKFGCLDGNILASNKRHIIAAGVVDTNSVADFQPVIYAVGDNTLQRPSTFSGAGAFSFLAKPLASTTSGTTGVTSRQYSIHVISNIAHVDGNKREVRNMHSIHRYPTKTSMVLRDQVPVANDSNPPALTQFAVVQEIDAGVSSLLSSSSGVLASSFSPMSSLSSSSRNGGHESYSSAANVLPNLTVLFSLLSLFAMYFY